MKTPAKTADQQQAHTIDFDAIMVDLDDEPIIDGRAKAEQKPLTLASICEQVLSIDFAGEAVNGPEKLRRARLAGLIHRKRQLVLKAEDVTLVKILVAKGWPPLIVMRAYPLLDPAEAEPAD